MDQFITVQAAAAAWQISDRRVTVFCKTGRIPRAVKVGKSWKIPADTPRPSDNRVHSQNSQAAELHQGDDASSASVRSQTSAAVRSASSKASAGKNRRPLPVGISSFQQVAENCYYVDQTLMIRDLLEHPSVITLITRPEGFGKSLMMDMLACFFGNKDIDLNKSLFQGKKISFMEEVCQKHQGKYPMIRMSFGTILSDNWSGSMEGIRNKIRELYSAFAEVLEGSSCNEWEIDYVSRMIKGQVADTELTDSLGILSRLLHEHYGIAPILLIDDYDTPIRSGYQHGYAGDAAFFIRNLLASASKDNQHLTFGVITGMLDLTSDPLFEELNRWTRHTLEEEGHTGLPAFDQQMVERMLSYYHMEDQMDSLSVWCGNYGYGEGNSYRPASVIEYIERRGKNKARQNPSEALRTILHGIINGNNTRMLWQLEKLLKGELILVKASAPDLMNDLDWNGSEAIYENLIHMGYLKASMSRELGDGSALCQLSVTNKECLMAFRRQLMNMLGKMVGEGMITNLQEDCCSEMNENVIEGVRNLLAASMEADQKEKLNVQMKNDSFLPCLVLLLEIVLSDFYQVTSDRDDQGSVARIIFQNEDGKLPGIIIQIHHIHENTSEAIRRQARNNLRQMQAIYMRKEWVQTLGHGLTFFSLVYSEDKVCLLKETR